MNRRTLAAFALAASAACSGSQAQPETATAPSDSAAAVTGAPAAAATDSSRERQRRRPRRDRNVITREEIEELGQGHVSLYDFVVSQHVEWLRAPGGRLVTSRPISVYLDGVRWGESPETMRQIPLTGVYMARRLGPSEAAGKYGMDNNSGTVEVFSSADRVR